jgi:hypothetical protein
VYLFRCEGVGDANGLLYLKEVLVLYDHILFAAIS